MKKILHIIAQSSYAGVTAYVFRIVKNLPDYNHRIVACYKGSAIDEIQAMDIPCEHLVNSNQISYRSLLLKYFKSVLFLMKNRFDIIHYHQGGVGVLLLALMIKKKACIIHHFHAANLIGDHSKFEISKLHSILLKYLSSRVVKVAVAEHILANYRNTIIDDDNAMLIYNSAPYNFSKKVKTNFKIGYIGRINVRKGFCELINISAFFNQKKSSIKFIAQGEFDEDLGKAADNSNIDFSNVTFQVDNFYNKIDLLFFLSTSQEGLPLVILEAIAFDVGVIAYPLKGVMEILGENYPLYVNSPSEAISKIDNFYSDKFDREQLSNIHHERSNNFLFDDMIRKLSLLYNSLLSED